MELKDQLLRDSCLEQAPGSVFYKLEGEIVRTAIRDYEQ